jgi:hypothetical protein
MANMTLTPKMWAGGMAFMGLLVLITGILSLRPVDATSRRRDPQCAPSSATYINIFIGAVMIVFAGMTLAKMSKKGGAKGMAKAVPESDMTDGTDMGGDMGGEMGDA